MHRARLGRYGLLSVTGEEARAFLHAQLTNDIEGLAPDRAALAGWCSAQGRLLATFLVVPSPQGFLLQLARDIAPAVAKRLGMFVLSAKVKIVDEGASWVQDGIWDADFSQPDVAWKDGVATVRVGERRYVQLGAMIAGQANATEEDWVLREIQAGRPFISSATQDKFVPQMVNLEKLGGVDFQKGCYPGQEIVARAQYRGQVKRRMVQMRGAAHPGEEFNGGTVVDAAGGELLVVAPI